MRHLIVKRVAILVAILLILQILIFAWLVQFQP